MNTTIPTDAIVKTMPRFKWEALKLSEDKYTSIPIDLYLGFKLQEWMPDEVFVEELAELFPNHCEIIKTDNGRVFMCEDEISLNGILVTYTQQLGRRKKNPKNTPRHVFNSSY